MGGHTGQISGGKKFLVYHFPTILYAFAIIAVSSIPDIRAPRLRFLAIDKLAHFVEYAVFSYLTFRSLSNLGTKTNVNRCLILSALFLCFFAVFDEYYQHLIPGRFSDIYDFFADLLGAFLVLIFFWVRLRRLKRTTG